MNKKDLESYFGKKYQSDPSELKGLNASQKSNLSIIPHHKICIKQNYTIKKQEYFDNDKGRYMNFVQPITWAYGTQTDNI